MGGVFKNTRSISELNLIAAHVGHQIECINYSGNVPPSLRFQSLDSTTQFQRNDRRQSGRRIEACSTVSTTTTTQAGKQRGRQSYTGLGQTISQSAKNILQRQLYLTGHKLRETQSPAVLVSSNRSLKGSTPTTVGLIS